MVGKSKKIKVIFIGTSDFGLPSLKWLVKKYQDILVITQPDKPVGRRQELASSPIKKYALAKGLVLYQPENINSEDAVKKIEDFEPDVMIVVAFGQILKQTVLDLPKFGCLNLHASLLPKYRGASPIQAAILNGDKKTGVTIIKMDKGLDTGDIVAKKNINIKESERVGVLHDKLASLASELLADVLPAWLAGKIKPIKQDDSLATYTSKITRADGQINPAQMTAEEIYRRFRAYHPWPGVWLKDEKLGRIKILGLELKRKNFEPSQVQNLVGKNQLCPYFLINKSHRFLYLKCRDTYLEVTSLQRAGGQVVSAQEFLSGLK